MRVVWVGVLALVGCTNGISLLPTFPQVEQARQSVQGGFGKRYEDYRACSSTNTDVTGLVKCMEESGYQYISRSAEAQATECWQIRDGLATGRLPESYCFVHAPAAR